MKKRKQIFKVALHELRKKWGLMVLSILVLVTISIGLSVRHLSTRSRAEGVEAGSESLSEVVGGNPANPDDWKFFVLLAKSFITKNSKTGDEIGFSFFCGGSLIRQKWILTAAHCLKDQQTDNMYVILGASSLKLRFTPEIYAQGDITGCGSDERCLNNGKSVKFVKVARLFAHGEFEEKTGENDIGLVELSEVVSEVEKYPLVSLIGEIKESDVTYFNAGDVFVGGFGRISPRLTPQSADDTTAGIKFPLQMQETVMKLKAMSPGRDQLFTEERRSGKITGACSGDSGGPVMFSSGGLFGYGEKRVQVGVISGGHPLIRNTGSDEKYCGGGDEQPGFDGYTSVFYYLPWIRSYTEK